VADFRCAPCVRFLTNRGLQNATDLHCRPRAASSSSDAPLVEAGGDLLWCGDTGGAHVLDDRQEVRVALSACGTVHYGAGGRSPSVPLPLLRILDHLSLKKSASGAAVAAVGLTGIGTAPGALLKDIKIDALFKFDKLFTVDHKPPGGSIAVPSFSIYAEPVGSVGPFLSKHPSIGTGGHDTAEAKVAVNSLRQRLERMVGWPSPALTTGPYACGTWDGDEPPRVLEGHSNWVGRVALSADGRRAVSGSRDKTLRVWDLEGSQPPRVLEGHNNWVNSVTVSADGRMVVSGSGDKTVRVWDLQSGEPPSVLEGHSNQINSVMLSADGRRAVSGSSDKTVRVWDLERCLCLSSFTCDAPVLCCAWVGDRIAAGDVNGRLTVKGLS
jgi:WD40 repeat protein